jgi:hypothetical protein
VLHRLEPVLVQAAHALDGLLRDVGFLQRRLVARPHVLLLLVEAVLVLRRVLAFLGVLVAELDDLDGVNVAAHRVEVHDGVEVAVERARAVGVRADVVVLRARVAPDRRAARVGRTERSGEQQGTEGGESDAAHDRIRKRKARAS